MFLDFPMSYFHQIDILSIYENNLMLLQDTLMNLNIFFYRAKIAQSLGAEIVIDPIRQNTKDAVMDATKGVGATIVIDASGRPEAMAQTLEVAAFHGRVVIIGISVGGKAETEMGLIQSKELQVRGIIGSPGVWPETIRFLSRTNLDLSKLVTSTFDISDADKAYQKVLTDKSQVKVHVTNSGK